MWYPTILSTCSIIRLSLQLGIHFDTLKDWLKDIVQSKLNIYNCVCMVSICKYSHMFKKPYYQVLYIVEGAGSTKQHDGDYCRSVGMAWGLLPNNISLWSNSLPVLDHFTSTPSSTKSRHIYAKLDNQTTSLLVSHRVFRQANLL